MNRYSARLKHVVGLLVVALSVLTVGATSASPGYAAQARAAAASTTTAYTDDGLASSSSVTLVKSSDGFTASRPPEAVASASPPAPSPHTYDAPVYDAPWNNAVSERAPPAHGRNLAAYDAVGRWSPADSVRSGARTTPAIYNYNDPTRFARTTRGSHGIEWSTSIGGAGPAVVKGSGVAAKAGTEVAETCLNSFTGTTLVLMADGTKKLIRDVRLGDWVMAADPKTGETGPRKVIDLIRHSGPHTMVAVRLSDGSTIDATDKHPFWVETRGEWVDAIDLQPGDVVIDADGDRLTVTSLGISEQDLTAYNLTVDGLHTYFAGSDSVLVHNAGCMSLADALATTHGQERLAARGFDNVDIAIARSSNLAYEQADGAIAHVAQLGDVYNVVVVGERGVVTGMKGLTENQLGNLARNYGWSGYP